MSSQKELVEYLKGLGILKSPQLIKAFGAIDRADFVLPDLKYLAYADEPLPIGSGQTISQPYTVAFMMELLNPQSKEKIMDVGAGSGWTSAILAQIIGEKGKIFSFEIVPELCELGINNVSKFNFIKKGIIEWHCKNAEYGLASAAPFDKIICAAALSEEIPRAWQEQLKVGGIIITPIQSSVWKYIKQSDGSFSKEEYPGFAFVPFINNAG